MNTFFPVSLLALIMVALPSSSEAQKPLPMSAGLADSLDIAQPQSEKNHAYASQGAVARQISGNLVGGHDLRRMARVVGGSRSWVSYRLKVQPGAPITLEFEELENRAGDSSQDAVRAYSLFVDGKRAYFRTAQSSSGGPLHFFVQVPPRARDFLDLRLQNESEVPFNLGRIWAFSDFPTYFERAGMAVPYHLAPTIALTFSDKEADGQKLRAIKTSFGEQDHARPAWTMWMTYANLSDSEIARRLDYTLALAQEFDLPVQICFDTWWGSTPNGSDGQGGFWSDVEYQQVVYNQNQKKFQLSVPNRWGNTPWLSVNHPRLNAFKVQRLQSAMKMLQERELELRARSKENLILAVNLDNEPVYWATGNAGLGNEILQADFGAAALQAARRDGVTLDPTNGLDFAERLWLWRNLLGYQELIAAAATRAGRDAIVVDSSGARAAPDPLRNNTYTQAFVANGALQFPMQNPAYPLWETGAPASARVGGEWNGDSLREREAVLHQLPLGRTAQVNAETGKRESEIDGVRPGYALGQRYYALYNYPHDKMNVAGREIRDTSQKSAPAVYERVIRQETFTDDTWKTRAVATEGLERVLIGNTTAMSLAPISNQKPGYVTYRLDSPQGFPGLSIELSGRAFVSQAKSADVFIKVLAGSDQNRAAMREIGVIFDNGDINAVHRFDLSNVARGQKSVWVRLEISAAKLPPTVLNWAALYHLRFTQPYPAALLQDVFAQDESIERQRQQNLLVSWRRDAELSIARLAQNPISAPQSAARAHSQALQSARESYARGEYAAAYRGATLAASFALPGATFRVTAPGQLAPFPISVQSAAPLTFTLHSWNADGVGFSLQNAPSAGATVEFGELERGKSYVVVQEQGSWILRPTRRGDGAQVTRLVADAAGKVHWTAPASPIPQTAQKTEVQGTFRAIWSETPPAISFWREDGLGFERVAISEKTQILRGEPGQEKTVAFNELMRGDDIVVSYDEGGLATRVVAGARTLEGIVAEAAPLTPYAMPFVRLQDSSQRHIIDLSAPLSIPDSGGSLVNTMFRAASLGTLALKTGDLVKMRINPRSGRVFELAEIRPPTP